MLFKVAFLSCSDDSFSGGSLKRKFLTPTAIEVLSDWYEANKGHPYPDESTVEELAQKANVTTNQVNMQINVTDCFQYFEKCYFVT